MIKVAVVLEDTSRVGLGEYEFETVPRIKDTIHIPSKDDDYGLRIFVVEEVWHYAPATPKPEEVGDHLTALVVSEIR